MIIWKTVIITFSTKRISISYTVEHRIFEEVRKTDLSGLKLRSRFLME